MRLRFCLFLFLAVEAVSSSVAVEPHRLMPQEGDHVSMWWAEGFPSHSKDMPWQRCFQTGHFGLVLDTESMQIPHFGPLVSGELSTLPSAKLGLRIVVDRKPYDCVAGGSWTRKTGPRLIESGRFFQRGDVTDLVFKSSDGETLNVDARLETSAWPDRFGLTLFARPGKLPAELGSKATSREPWKSCDLAITLQSNQGTLKQDAAVGARDGVVEPSWHRVSLSIDPIVFEEASPSPISVKASEIGSGAKRPVVYDDALGWYRVNLDGVEPIVSKHPTDEESDGDARNDAMERVRLALSNASGREQLARLMFEKTRSGIRQRIGTPITGISAVLRDADGNPTGIPVQLSKNWHVDGSDDVHATQWFHGISQIRLPANSSVELELSIVYGHWGGVAAASTSQLSLIGWGSNQLWNQAAIGSWGESICVEPDQVQANCSVTDVRPLMLKSQPSGELWRWTGNVGGGDFFRMFDREGKRIPHTSMKTTFHRYGPCLTEVTNGGQLTDAITHAETINLARSDDLLRVTYQLKMQVNEATDFSRLAIFQVGADTYNFTRERKMAIGNATGLIKQWKTTWGGDQYRMEPIQCIGHAPWASLHDAIPQENHRKPESWANRGIVIRSWKARLGGKKASPWMAERGVDRHRQSSSTLDIVPPPDVTRLEPGDFVDATIEHLVVPRDAEDYYGPNKDLRAALAKDANTWQMIAREALGNRHETLVEVGELQHRHPDVCIRTLNDEARCTIVGGIGYVPITFTGLTSPSGYTLMIDGQRLDQSVHGNDFWQTDYNARLKQWSQTYNVPAGENGTVCIHFRKSKEPR